MSEVFYHVNIHGDPAICRAKTPESCRAKTPEGVEQFHSANESSVEDFAYRELSLFSSNVRKTDNTTIQVTSELLGSRDTDVERLEETDTSRGAHQLWLRDTEGRPMAFISVLEKNGEMQLCDLEVRPEYRGHGLVKRVASAVEQKYGKDLTHHGGYTPEGLKAIAPLFHSKETIETELNAESYEPMTFVDDWDSTTPKFML